MLGGFFYDRNTPLNCRLHGGCMPPCSHKVDTNVNNIPHTRAQAYTQTTLFRNNFQPITLLLARLPWALRNKQTDNNSADALLSLTLAILYICYSTMLMQWKNIRIITRY